MKPLFYCCILLCSALACLAQTSPTFAFAVVPTMTLTNNEPAISSAVSQKLLTKFSHEFRDAQSPKWHVTKKGYSVEFMQSDIRYRVTYTRHARWENTIQTFQQPNIPSETVRLMEDCAPGFNVLQQVNVTTSFGSVSIVKIISRTFCRTYWIREGETELKEEFRLASAN